VLTAEESGERDIAVRGACPELIEGSLSNHNGGGVVKLVFPVLLTLSQQVGTPV